MGKKATKASDSIYCMARYEAAEKDPYFESRSNAAETLGIEKTRLARIELGTLIPYPEEVVSMANAYNTPELCNAHCATICPIGQQNVTQVNINDFDRLALKALGSLKDIDELRASLIALSEDGSIDTSEEAEFSQILEALDKISQNAIALKLWAKKNTNIDFSNK